MACFPVPTAIYLTLMQLVGSFPNTDTFVPNLFQIISVNYSHLYLFVLPINHKSFPTLHNPC